MSSLKAWKDYDPAAREQSLRILALFQVWDNRHELCLGAIQDAFANCMYPGTSTIQTRLRNITRRQVIHHYFESSKISKSPCSPIL